MRFYITAVCTVLMSWPVALWAEAPARPDPADAAAATPAARYDSAFAGYQAYREQQVGVWREHNDEMGRVGGHAGHLKGAAPEPSAGSELGTPKPAPDNGAHHKH